MGRRDGVATTIEELGLADWRRQVGEIYVEVRRLARIDPAAALAHWQTERERLFREHLQSPVLLKERPAFRAQHFDHDPTLRFELVVSQVAAPETATGAAAAASATIQPGDVATAISAVSASQFGLSFAPPLLDLPTSGGGAMVFRKIGSVEIPFAAGPRSLSVYWMEGYAGGLFVPFRDATNGHETYGAGRYAVDAAKSADLGGDPVRGTIVIDFNFAYQPSCAFDPKWSCPLAPRENWLDVPVRAGERIA